MKSVFIIAIVAVAMIGVMVPNVFAEILLPSGVIYEINTQRLKEIPTFCIIGPENFSEYEKTKYTRLAQQGVAEWDRALQYSGVGGKFSSNEITIAEAQAKWKIHSKIISSYDSQEDCTIVLSFHETVGTESHPNAIGWFIPASQSITIAYKNRTMDQIYNTITHEIGHAFGLGHYYTLDDEKLNGWISGKIPQPSIMVPTANRVPSQEYIEDVDIQMIISLYGSNGFTAFSPQTPQVPLPDPITKPIIPIFPFDNIQITDDVILNKYESTYLKITGQIKESEFFKGHPVYITIKKSDGTWDIHKIKPTRSGYFELPLIFDKNSPTGYYTANASYLDHMDHSMEFLFLVDFKNNSSTINDPKTNPQIDRLFITANTMGGSDAKIIVTGKVSNLIPGDVPITLTVVNPLNSLVTIDQINVSNDGSFTTTIDTSGNLWKYTGTYTIKVNYGGLENNVKVELTDGIAVDKETHNDVECGSSEVAIRDTCTPYTITSGDVISATINPDDNSIILNIDAEDSGVLIIIPSPSIQKGIFMVLVDDEQVFDDGGFHSATISDNTVIVGFSGGTEQIEIVGTYVISEFDIIEKEQQAEQQSLQSEIVSSKKLGFQTLKNLEYGFSLDYPREWSFEENIPSDPVSVYSLYFLIPDSMSFEVGVWKQSDYELKTVGVDYLNYMMDWIKDQCDNSLAYANEECTNYRLESAEIIKINNMDAYQIKYSMMDSYGSLTKIITDFKSPDYAFTIFAIADTDKFYNYENDFNAAINSFDLENEYVIEDQYLETESEITTSENKGGGCLIATATYGSEMANEVQQLRELRDNQLLQTESGTAFMGTFNDIYYSFSPTIADYERENPYFKEAVKLAITPMISSLSLMENANSESEVLSIGISVIMLNLGMYLGVPAIVIIGIKRKF